MVESVKERGEQDTQRDFRRNVMKLLGCIFLALIAVFILEVGIFFSQTKALERARTPGELG